MKGHIHENSLYIEYKYNKISHHPSITIQSISSLPPELSYINPTLTLVVIKSYFHHDDEIP